MPKHILVPNKFYFYFYFMRPNKIVKREISLSAMAKKKTGDFRAKNAKTTSSKMKNVEREREREREMAV